MQTTAEMRWFYEGAVPPAVTGWFEALGAVGEEEVRTDHYLAPTGGALNVKLRGGRLEIKRAEGEQELCQLHPRVAGRLEHWQKWSFPLASEREVEDLEGSSRWRAVRKARRLQSYRVGQEGVSAASEEASPAQGCDLELARVEVGGQTWWSLCFEAYGPAHTLRETLLQTAQHALARGEPPTLALDNARGYAAWLFHLQRRLA